MPPVTRIQAKKEALPGPMRISPEGSLAAWFVSFVLIFLSLVKPPPSRPGDNPNQCTQGYNCPPPTLSIDPFVPSGNRFVDVGVGGPNPFTFTVTNSAPWLNISPNKGSVSPSSPEQRVFFSVDWSKVTTTQATTVTFTAVSPGQPNLITTLTFTANHTSVPSDFKG